MNLYALLSIALCIAPQALCMEHVEYKAIGAKKTSSMHQFKQKKSLSVHTSTASATLPVRPPVYLSMPAQPICTVPTREEFFSEKGELCCCTVGCWICGCSLAMTSGLFALSHYINRQFAHRR